MRRAAVIIEVLVLDIVIVAFVAPDIISIGAFMCDLIMVDKKQCHHCIVVSLQIHHDFSLMTGELKTKKRRTNPVDSALIQNKWCI